MWWMNDELLNPAKRGLTVSILLIIIIVIVVLALLGFFGRGRMGR
jgi:hypothetical protein